MKNTQTSAPAPLRLMKSRPSKLRKLLTQKQQLLITLPLVALVVVFNYMPLYGWIMAFLDYKVIKGISGSPFVGFDKFAQLFRDDQFYLVLRNTLVMGFLNLFATFVGSIVLALALNEIFVHVCRAGKCRGAENCLDAILGQQCNCPVQPIEIKLPLKTRETSKVQRVKHK
ncbi:hypothetical protein ASG89_09980 [Paenibacillus sp. Soil766]|nr:hypothetical protein [Paenibacillus sp. Soil766]KRE86343.1 hypothetical protein ASG89_09980 [Paenibacillus sp. Soil766]